MGSVGAITVLVHEFATGGGFAGADVPPSWLAEGAAMRRALLAEFAAVPGVRVIGTRDRRQPDEPGLPARVEPIDPDRECEQVLALAAACDHTLLVAPESGGELLRRARALERAGLSSLGSAPGAIELAGDKARLGIHLARLGIPTPPGRVVRRGDPWHPPGSGPWVAKPVDGAGSLDTFRIEPGGLPPADLDALPEYLVQSFAPGEACSASFLVDAVGRATPLAVGRQRIVVDRGRFRYDGGELPVPCDTADLAVVERAVAAVPGLRGFVGVDFACDLNRAPGRGISVIEINPRPTTSLAGLVRVFPPGAIARAWIAGLRATPDPTARPAAPEPGRTVRFDPAGLLPEPEQGIDP